MKLNELRKEIDNIDNDIINLLIKRFNVVLEVKQYKIDNNISVLDKAREDIIKNKIINYQSNFNNNILSIYESILKESKDLQK